MTNVLLKLSHVAGSTVNFIFGCKLLKAFFETLRSNAECHGIEPSSIYLLNIYSINLKLS